MLSVISNTLKVIELFLAVTQTSSILYRIMRSYPKNGQAEHNGHTVFPRRLVRRTLGAIV